MHMILLFYILCAFNAFIVASSLEWRRGIDTPALQSRPLGSRLCCHAAPELRFAGTRAAPWSLALLARSRGRRKCARCPGGR